MSDEVKIGDRFAPYEPRCGDFVGRVMTPVVRR